MRILSLRSRALVLSSVLAAWTALGLACSVEDENPATTRPRNTDSGGGSSGSVEEGGDPPTGAPICGKYGDITGVKGIADAIVATAIADCRIGLVVENARNRNNDQSHFDQCFQQFVGGGFQCPGVTFVAGTTTDIAGKKCNKQLENVTFSDIDFNAFLQNVQSALKTKGLSDDEIRSIAPVFEGARARLVNNNLPKTKHTQCRESCELGKEACIKPIVDAGQDANDGGGGDDKDSGSDADASE